MKRRLFCSVAPLLFCLLVFPSPNRCSIKSLYTWMSSGRCVLSLHGLRSKTLAMIDAFSFLVWVLLSICLRFFFWGGSGLPLPPSFRCNRSATNIYSHQVFCSESGRVCKTLTSCEVSSTSITFFRIPLIRLSLLGVWVLWDLAISDGVDRCPDKMGMNMAVLF